MHKNIMISLLSQCGLFIHTCVSQSSCLSKDEIFYLLWYNVIRWSGHICNTWEWLSKIDKAWQSGIGWKISLCKWHTFWMAQCLICYFIVMLYYIEKKWLLMRNLATMLPLKFNLSGKFLHFNTIDRSMEMLKISWIFRIFN